MSSAGAAGGGGDASGGLGALMANLAHANGSGAFFPQIFPLAFCSGKCMMKSQE
jgi:hypothetical protein